MRPAPSTPFAELFHTLCFDTTVTLTALIGYAARALLRSPAPVQAHHHHDLGRLLPSRAIEPGEDG
ncbi:hypothetical protein [Actinokineospora sp. HUAS TT18]|uniref:hypothetical protein n=1 Tax=Actinokineospora sp. HUAS TT18 TaxID=3447451 RepID=UPI003F526ECF